MATWDGLKRLSLFFRTAVFRLCIFHGILCMRQKFGTRAMVKEYEFGLYDLEQAIQLFIQLCDDENIESPAIITRHCCSVAHVSLMDVSYNRNF